jgi:SH3-like domain-containing protein
MSVLSSVIKLTVVTAVAVLAIFPAFTGVCAAERLAVAVAKANVRSAPDTKSDVLWEVEKYHPVSVLSTKGDWCRFRDFEGDIAWIYRKLLKKIPTVITARDNCNIRSGPGTKNRILLIAEKGIPFKVLKRKGKWLHIQHADGDKGWIHRSLTW